MTEPARAAVLPVEGSDADAAATTGRGAAWCLWLLIGWAVWIGLACVSELGDAENLGLTLDLSRHVAEAPAPERAAP